MHYYLAHLVAEADDYVKRHPNKAKPASPVSASKHEYPAEQRKDSTDRHQRYVH